MNYSNIQAEDPKIYEIIKREEQRQKEGIELIVCLFCCCSLKEFGLFPSG
jgi:hypothetical protein